MKASFVAMDLAYEASFQPMYFEIAERGPALLKSMHKNLSSYGYIGSGDMQVFGGTSLSDAGVRVSMFNQHARIEISATSCIIRFTQMSNSADLRLCKACVSAVEDVLNGELANPRFGFYSLDPLCWLDLKGVSATDFLADLVTTKNPLQLSRQEGVRIHRGVNIELENDLAQWNAIMNLFRVRDNPSQIMFSCRVIYGEDSSIRGSTSQIEHLEELMNLFFSDVGLEVFDFEVEN